MPFYAIIAAFTGNKAADCEIAAFTMHTRQSRAAGSRKQAIITLAA
jgi:hypothetical protein